jgi:tetratricopeptide (TPR) repeat protein
MSPTRYTPEIPIGVDVKEDFAEYHASHHVKDGVLISERDLVVKALEVPTAEFDAYKKFTKVVNDDYGAFIALSSRNSPVTAQLRTLLGLPFSENPEAVQAFNQAGVAFRTRDLQDGIASLKRAVELDPKFTRAWLALGQAYAGSGQVEEAVQSYRKALKADPQQPVIYDALGALLARYKPEEAVAVWQELVKTDPKNGAALAALGSSLYRSKRYKEAAAALQSALELTPDNGNLQEQLGSAYLRTGDEEKAMKAFGEAVSLDDTARTLNDVAYNLADANKDLPEALQYAEKAVLEEEQASQDVDADYLEIEDIAHANRLAAYWDTLGWVHFRMGDFEQAEKYLNSAWTLSEDGTSADHLGQVYERQNKKQAAIRLYRIALYCYPAQGMRESSEMRETEARLKRLTPDSGTFSEISEDVNRTRTVKLGHSIAGSATAEFFLIFERDAQTGFTKVQSIKFISGSDELRAADKILSSAKFDVIFPDDGPTRLVRRGILSCYKSVGCSFTFVNPRDVHSLN